LAVFRPSEQHPLSDGKRSVIIRAQYSELTNNTLRLVTNGEIWRVERLTRADERAYPHRLRP
jgi:hypothetical protein